MFSVSSSPNEVTFDSYDDALAQLTEVYEQFEYATSLYQRSDFALNDIKARLNEFVKNSQGATEASAIIEALVEEFDLEKSRRLSATVDVRYTISVDAPYTVSIDDFEAELGSLDYGINLRYGMNNDCEMIDAYVEEVSVWDIDED